MVRGQSFYKLKIFLLLLAPDFCPSSIAKSIDNQGDRLVPMENCNDQELSGGVMHTTAAAPLSIQFQCMVIKFELKLLADWSNGG